MTFVCDGRSDCCCGSIVVVEVAEVGGFADGRTLPVVDDVSVSRCLIHWSIDLQPLLFPDSIRKWSSRRNSLKWDVGSTAGLLDVD